MKCGSSFDSILLQTVFKQDETFKKLITRTTIFGKKYKSTHHSLKKNIKPATASAAYPICPRLNKTPRPHSTKYKKLDPNRGLTTKPMSALCQTTETKQKEPQFRPIRPIVKLQPKRSKKKIHHLANVKEKQKAPSKSKKTKQDKDNITPKKIVTFNLGFSTMETSDTLPSPTPQPLDKWLNKIRTNIFDTNKRLFGTSEHCLGTLGLEGRCIFTGIKEE